MILLLLQSLSKSFCNAIGLQEPSRITIKTSVNSTELWEVHDCPGKKNGYIFRLGWWRFCRENGLKGDTCTFNIMEKTVWLVDIIRSKECCVSI
jgi:hypothetical protein